MLAAEDEISRLRAERDTATKEARDAVEKYERLVKNDREMLDSVSKRHAEEKKRLEESLVERTKERDALAWWVCQNHLKVLDPKV